MLGLRFDGSGVLVVVGLGVLSLQGSVRGQIAAHRDLDVGPGVVRGAGAIDAATAPEVAGTVIVGSVIGPDGAPAVGAVVVTSAGGRAVTDAEGAFSLEAEVPVGAASIRVTAVMGSGLGSLIGSSQLGGLTLWGTTVAGTLVLEEAASCQPSWLPTFGQAQGVTVVALTVFDDGSGPALYAGGYFPTVGGMTVNSIAKWNGSIWSALGSGTDSEVDALTVFDDGSGPALYAGGYFTTAGGVAANRIAKWNGTSWSALGSGMGGFGLSTRVNALTSFDDGSGPALYAGGFFSTAGAVGANYIAKWNGTTWAALGSGMDWFVEALTVFDDGSGPALYAGGYFTTAGGVAANRIAKWNGTSWSALGSGMFGLSANVVAALAVFDDGSGPALYAGGGFTTAGGVTVNSIAKWNGASWSALGSGMSSFVNALTVFDDGSGPALYAGGDFTAAGSVAAIRIAKWDGASWSALGSGMGGSSPFVEALSAFDDGSGSALYAGGHFGTAGGIPANNISKWNGMSWFGINGPIDFLAGPVAALAVFDDGSGPALYAGGQFLTAGGMDVYYIAKWDGASWSALGSGVEGTVLSLTVFDDGSGPALYAGGEFASTGGVSANHVARWKGTSWSSLGSGVNLSVHALTVFDDGSGPALYAGGEFTTAGGAAANSMARWNGANWSTLGSGMNSSVEALMTFDDGSGAAMYAGGWFTTAGGVAANRIAKWNGSSWSALSSGVAYLSFSGVVDALTVFDDGSGPALYAGGTFTTAGGVAANSIAKWNGTSWSALGSGMNSSVAALLTFDDAGGPALYAGGGFTTAGGATANSIAKWNGSSWSALGSGMNNPVLALTVFDDGSGPALYAGGSFTSAIDSLDSYLAKWGGCSPPPLPWTKLGSGLAGISGIPQLNGTGTLEVGTSGNLSLVDAAPSAPAALFISGSNTPTPFKGGILLTVPVLLTLALPTDPLGDILLPWTAFPSGLSGVSLYFQYAIQDAAAVKGVALSNALGADVP